MAGSVNVQCCLSAGNSVYLANGSGTTNLALLDRVRIQQGGAALRQVGKPGTFCLPRFQGGPV